MPAHSELAQDVNPEVPTNQDPNAPINNGKILHPVTDAQQADLDAAAEITGSDDWVADLLARLFDSEPTGSNIRTVADKFFKIAREHAGFVPKDSDDNAVIRAVRYIAHVHARSYLGDDTAWFHHTLNVLLELAHPSEILTPEAAKFLADIEKGISEARGQIF